MAGLVPAIHVLLRWLVGATHASPLRSKQTWLRGTSPRMTAWHALGTPMLDTSTPLVFPQLGRLYQLLSPWAEMALRAVVGLALVPHGLRNTFGMFPSTGVRAHNLTELARQLDRDGYRPGKFWAPAISITQLVGGPLLALGLFTRPAALAIVLFLVVSNYERWRVGGYFWNKTGLEYTLMWTLAALYFLIHGGGTISLDRLLIGREL